jgi:hypothetical protein
MKILDAGHRYSLVVLDRTDDTEAVLTFVKRFDPLDPSKFPGNFNSYQGTTSQEVIRCLLDRARYVQNQKWCLENVIVIFSLRIAIWALEFRASRKHRKLYFKSMTYAEHQQMCPLCGHTNCKHKAV